MRSRRKAGRSPGGRSKAASNSARSESQFDRAIMLAGPRIPACPTPGRLLYLNYLSDGASVLLTLRSIRVLGTTQQYELISRGPVRKVAHNAGPTTHASEGPMVSVRNRLKGIGEPSASHKPLAFRASFGRRTPRSMRMALDGMTDPAVANWQYPGPHLQVREQRGFS